MICASTAVPAYIFNNTVSILGVVPDRHVRKVLDILPKTAKRDVCAPKSSLHDVLIKFRDAQCIDPRDPVYGLLEMVSDKDQLNLSPNYGVLEAETFQHTITHILNLPDYLRVHLPTWTWEDFKCNLEFLSDKITQFAIETDCTELLQYMRTRGMDINASNAPDQRSIQNTSHLNKHRTDLDLCPSQFPDQRAKEPKPLPWMTPLSISIQTSGPMVYQ